MASSSNHVVSFLAWARPTYRGPEVLTLQTAAAVAVWVEQVPGEPGQSRQPGSTLSLLKCGEANIIAPETGPCNIKTNKRENRVNITELKGKINIFSFPQNCLPLSL